MKVKEKIYLKKIPRKGRGVFAGKNFKKGETIEVCPVIPIPGDEVKYLDKCELTNYYFFWGKKDDMACIALGYGSLYNHSYEPNATYEDDFDKQIMIFTALRVIKKGEEIMTNYNGEEDEKTPVWFHKNYVGK